MDATVHRSSKAEGREFVNSATPVGIEEGYQRWAPTYDHTINPVLALEERHIMPLLGIVEERFVLDLACGTGRWLQKLIARGARVGVGIDSSAAMLRVANAKPALRGRLTKADCLQLPFRGAIFDFAICSFALNHILQLKDAVTELALLMKPNADVFVTDLHAQAYAQGWRTSFRDKQDVLEIEALPRTVVEIADTFQTGGFECVEHAPLYFGEAEKPLFERTGKAGVFRAACRIPAILFCHFRTPR
jgi:ubiquinone/menaquinone biosynthesis C-methylase UbiE